MRITEPTASNQSAFFGLIDLTYGVRKGVAQRNARTAEGTNYVTDK